ncbi:conserved hypothetical protein [Magnetospirillum sp. UT-4]|nr:conserved hypothetical protein [Magnetospirillum sp. UT-4]
MGWWAELGDRAAGAAVLARIGAGLAACRLRPGPRFADRLAALPTTGLPLSRPVRVWWDAHAIPFIDAETDSDAAFALGLVHAHLRLTQIEVFRRVATGRTAEMLGPAAVELDHGLRLLDFGRAVPAVLERMPAATRAWLDCFAAGLGHYAAHGRPLPPDLAWLGIRPEPWSAADVLTVGRLAGADVNWMVLFNLVRLRRRPDWPALWHAVTAEAGAVFPPLAGTDPLSVAATRLTRSGSNALAVAAHRSASGAALMAADPHLSLMLPGLWLAGAVRSPSFHMAGLMLPGLPFVAIGRNRRIAWSGTALQAASSELFDAHALPAIARRQSVAVRGRRRRREVVLRDTALGPLISDAAPLAGCPPLALAWVGHRPADELSAWLDIARAGDWTEFAAAAAGLAVPGQTLVYADGDGHVGKLAAAHLPRRPPTPPADAVLPPEAAAAWDDLATAAELPRLFDPPGGIVVSANEQPRRSAVRVGLFFAAHHRRLRLERLARRRGRLGLEDLAGFQQDVGSDAAPGLRDWLLARLPPDGAAAAALAGWDGQYGEASLGAAAFEAILARLHRFAHGEFGESAYWASWDPERLLHRRLAASDARDLAAAIAEAGREAGKALKPWGELHRLRLAHFTAALPLCGRLGRFTDLPSGGGNETVMKTAHGLADGRHAVRFGANARFLADLSDPDRNSVVLLGGQDGWPGSACFLDQLPLWRAGASVPLPLRPETAAAAAVHLSLLRP